MLWSDPIMPCPIIALLRTGLRRYTRKQRWPYPIPGSGVERSRSATSLPRLNLQALHYQSPIRSWTVVARRLIGGCKFSLRTVQARRYRYLSRSVIVGCCWAVGARGLSHLVARLSCWTVKAKKMIDLMMRTFRLQSRCKKNLMFAPLDCCMFP